MAVMAPVCQLEKLPTQEAHSAPSCYISTHLLIEMWHSPFHLLADAGKVELALQYAGGEDGEVISYQFNPYGVSAKATFAQSHIFIHTWPENGYAAIDVFASNEEEAYQVFERLKEAFQPQYVHALEMKRGQLIELEET
ncbi:adenosylmethionine decarboxylase [Thermosulfuriphilus sp.]